VGPTSNRSVHGRPLTDRRLNFEDLVIVALNFHGVSGPALAGAPAATPESRDALTLRAPELPRVGESFDVSLEAKGTGIVRAMSVLLDYDRDVVEPIGVEGGELLARQRSASIVLSSEPGNVDVALYGSEAGLAGAGEVARIRFRTKATGDPRLAFRRVDARSGTNESVAIALERVEPARALPERTALAPASPTPFTGSTTLRYSLLRAGAVDLTVFDVQGRVIRTLVDGAREAGEYSLVWDGRDDTGRRASPGLYLVRLRAEGRQFLREVWLAR
jgi:hypothetical protein